MIQFAHPWLYAGALAVPLAIWIWQRGRGVALRFPAGATLESLPAGKERHRRWLGSALVSLGLIFLIAALAGPRWPDMRTRITTEGIAMAMVVDVSGSMAEPDFQWGRERISRLEAVKRAFHLFVKGGRGPKDEQFEGRTHDQICLVTFSARPQSSWPLTLSHDPLLRILDEERPRSLPTEAQTNIGDAIIWALDRLGDSRTQRRIIVLLSDGEHNVPPPALKPRQAAQLAAALHVPIYAIDAGGTLPPKDGGISSQALNSSEAEAGSRTLQAVASLTGGRYFHAHDAQSLLSVCGQIDRLERQEMASFQYRRYYEAYPWFGAAALICLSTLAFLGRTFWLKVP